MMRTSPAAASPSPRPAARHVRPHAARLAPPPRRQPARAGPAVGRVAAPCQLPRIGPRPAQPRDGGPAQHRARRPAAPAQRHAAGGGLRAGLSRDQPRRARARAGAPGDRPHAEAAGALSGRRDRPAVEPACRPTRRRSAFTVFLFEGPPPAAAAGQAARTSCAGCSIPRRCAPRSRTGRKWRAISSRRPMPRSWPTAASPRRWPSSRRSWPIPTCRPRSASCASRSGRRRC